MPSVTFPATTVLDLLGRMLEGEPRVMLFGASGVGKTTLAGQLCRALHEHGHAAVCLSADVGLPGFGAPGAVGLARWDAGGWQLLDLEAVCSLDAVRFRLPLIMAVDRLLARYSAPVQVLDAPGVVRG
ncbi:MAG TPA: hypothetical protein VFL97_07540, partial [Nitrococcus sp.]|nr:hypothetical protein [Nitrococcus sp.]